MHVTQRRLQGRIRFTSILVPITGFQSILAYHCMTYAGVWRQSAIVSVGWYLMFWDDTTSRPLHHFGVYLSFLDEMGCMREEKLARTA